MSTEYKAKGPLALTRFSGGRERGMCLQMTHLDGPSRDGWWTSVRIEELPALIADLQAIVDGTLEEE